MGLAFSNKGWPENRILICEKKILVGRIIFANFLKLPLAKYKGFIENVEISPLFEKLLKNRTIIKKYLSGTSPTYPDNIDSSRVIAKIERNSKSFSIRYTCAGFNAYYLCSGRVYSACSGAIHGTVPIVNLFYKLRRINSRNVLTHRIIKGVIQHQGRYLNTGDPVNLVPLTQTEFANLLNKSITDSNFLTANIDISWISRLIKGISIITPSGEEKPLKCFFQTQKDINKRLIKQLLDKENEVLSLSKDEDIESGRLKKSFTDNQIKSKLEREDGVKLSRRSIGIYRKDMGIPPAKRRLSGYKYPPLSANFSMLYPLVLEEVLKNAPVNPGIYEFRLKEEELKYHWCKTSVIYIGSAKNLKKRLCEHLRENNKNGEIKYFLNKFSCSFRYIQISKNWKGEERRLYNFFVDTYGAPPKCNRVRP